MRRIPNDKGQPMPTIVYRPEELYPTRNGVAPDLLVYWGDLAWRSVGSVGNPSIYTFQNDTGPDDANHAQYGLIIYRPADSGSSGNPPPQVPEDARLIDMTPTILSLFGLEIGADLEGKKLF
jgi:predicted AlkP superfamily phosphohydrolase/phosphomutase